MIAFWGGLLLGVGVMMLGSTIDNSNKKNKDKESKFNIKELFPIGASNITNLGNGYFEYRYKKRDIMVYMPGTEKMSSVVIQTYI